MCSLTLQNQCYARNKLKFKGKGNVLYAFLSHYGSAINWHLFHSTRNSVLATTITLKAFALIAVFENETKRRMTETKSQPDNQTSRLTIQKIENLSRESKNQGSLLPLLSLLSTQGNGKDSPFFTKKLLTFWERFVPIQPLRCTSLREDDRCVLAEGAHSSFDERRIQLASLPPVPSGRAILVLFWIPKKCATSCR